MAYIESSIGMCAFYADDLFLFEDEHTAKLVSNWFSDKDNKPVSTILDQANVSSLTMSGALSTFAVAQVFDWSGLKKFDAEILNCDFDRIGIVTLGTITRAIIAYFRVRQCLFVKLQNLVVLNTDHDGTSLQNIVSVYIRAANELTDKTADHIRRIMTNNTLHTRSVLTNVQSEAIAKWTIEKFRERNLSKSDFADLADRLDMGSLRLRWIIAKRFTRLHQFIHGEIKELPRWTPKDMTIESLTAALTKTAE